MGLYTLPAPSEGVLVLLLVNTALSISILKDVVLSLLHVVGLHRGGAGAGAPRAGAADFTGGGAESFAERFRSRAKPVRFGTGRGSEDGVTDCRVCLARFEPDSVVNRLPCGHLFHSACLERWLDYHHVTCPLCRTHLLPADETAASSSSTWC